jgi:hypothetical protein
MMVVVVVVVAAVLLVVVAAAVASDTSLIDLLRVIRGTVGVLADTTGRDHVRPYFMRRTEAAAEIPLHFHPSHRRFLLSSSLARLARKTACVQMVCAQKHGPSPHALARALGGRVGRACRCRSTSTSSRRRTARCLFHDKNRSGG